MIYFNYLFGDVTCLVTLYRLLLFSLYLSDSINSFEINEEIETIHINKTKDRILKHCNIRLFTNYFDIPRSAESHYPFGIISSKDMYMYIDYTQSERIRTFNTRRPRNLRFQIKVHMYSEVNALLLK